MRADNTTYTGYGYCGTCQRHQLIRARDGRIRNHRNSIPGSPGWYAGRTTKCDGGGSIPAPEPEPTLNVDALNADRWNDIYNSQPVQAINPSTRYDADISHDAGLTWEDANIYQCGEGLRLEMVGAIESGYDLLINGPVVTVPAYDGTLTRWVPAV